MGERARWHELTCPCGGTEFFQVFALRRHTAGGLSQDPSGLRCIACHKPADTAAMMRTIQLEQAKKNYEEQMAALDAYSVNSDVSASASKESRMK